ncbi:MAG: response regulator transcription factor [Candidatus Latescibacteria bacterium]|nr:response regulator transcription factor [Candidatus Latescibacterota bacterium]
MERIRILLADDHAVLRAGLRLLLNAEPDMTVVGEAATGAEAVELAKSLHPDVVLMDLKMPGLGGVEATRYLKREVLHVKVLILTMHDDEGYLRQALRAGASGYVLKKAADTDLVAALRAVYRGETPIDPSMAKVLVEEYLEPGCRLNGLTEAKRKLTDREREVLTMLAQGFTNRQVADRLFVSVKTIETHRARIMEKLDFRTRAELVQYALQQGFLDTHS